MKKRLVVIEPLYLVHAGGLAYGADVCFLSYCAQGENDSAIRASVDVLLLYHLHSE